MLAQNDKSNAPFITISNFRRASRPRSRAHLTLCVRAEISRPTRAPSGHLYFTLKDERSTLAAVCWKRWLAILPSSPKGLEVICSGKLTIYPGQSKYQIVVSQIGWRWGRAAQTAGGTASPARRRRAVCGQPQKPLPQMPSVIGVVTSPTGAVLRDILHRLHDRFGVHVLVWGTLVQGQMRQTNCCRHPWI